MSLDSVFNRISELNSLLGGAAAAPAQTATAAHDRGHVVDRRVRDDAAQRLRHRLDDRDRGRHADPARRRCRRDERDDRHGRRRPRRRPGRQLARRAHGRDGPGRGRPGRAAPGLQQLPAHRPVPQRHRRRAGPGPVVRVLHLVARARRGRPGRRPRPGLRLGRRPLRVGAEERPRDPDLLGPAASRATSSSGTSTSASSSPSARTAASRRSRATRPTACPVASTPRATRSATCA